MIRRTLARVEAWLLIVAIVTAVIIPGIFLFRIARPDSAITSVA